MVLPVSMISSTINTFFPLKLSRSWKEAFCQLTNITSSKWRCNKGFAWDGASTVTQRLETTVSTLNDLKSKRPSSTAWLHFLRGLSPHWMTWGADDGRLHLKSDDFVLSWRLVVLVRFESDEVNGHLASRDIIFLTCFLSNLDRSLGMVWIEAVYLERIMKPMYWTQSCWIKPCQACRRRICSLPSEHRGHVAAP